jgi:hypothetical protein
MVNFFCMGLFLQSLSIQVFFKPYAPLFGKHRRDRRRGIVAEDFSNQLSALIRAGLWRRGRDDGQRMALRRRSGTARKRDNSEHGGWRRR